MGIMDIIWPWGALSDANKAITYLQDEFLKERNANARLTQQLSDANNRADQHSLTSLARANELARLQKLLKSAHFRNPATGRLGRKGETFS